METQFEKVWTYDDLVALGDPAHGERYEIFDGELVVSPAPSLWHQEVLKRLFLRFHAELEATRLARVYFAPLDVILSPTRVVEPDLLIVRTERQHILANRGVTAAPDLVVEIVSPSNSQHDRVRKRRFYAGNSIREYWVVDPEDHTIEVLALIDGGLTYRQVGWYATGDRARSVGFDLELEVDRIFERDDETATDDELA
ncbi:MAG: Uma2 family endonuclease [Kofleriaceae bacterium]